MSQKARKFAIAIADAERRRIFAANYLETAIVIDGSRDPIASRSFDDLIREAQIAIEPVTASRRELRAKRTAISAAAPVTPPG